MSALAAPIPLLTVVLLALLAALPWGGSDVAHSFLVLLPLAGVHFWTVRRPSLMPATGIFCAGLLTDVLTQGPLGFFAFVALAIGFVSRYLIQWPLLNSGHGRYALFVVIACGTSALIWILASFYVMTPLPAMPYVHATLLVAAAYPLLWVLLSGINALFWGQQQRPLFGGSP